ncbi:MAG: caspase family protein [Myxacorys californica WJT36-NPBG1]|jgi:uncharacterized caspase-like protein|nr:caspase family protein [Myxacorys californica WJT36-NPBG1]
MPPVGVGASRFASALETGEAKLWVLLIGVNQYQDDTLPPLRYAALDCQGLGEALSEATQPFPQKEFLIHHDLVSERATLATIQASLQRLVSEAKPKDTVLTYFSGHGIVDPASGQTVLCVSDTQKQNALQTGLALQEMLQMLGECDAHSQIVWLDACHSGNITLSGAKGSGAKGQSADPALLNPTPHLLELLRQRAAKSRGFYALLSCDQGQQSWEFPDLGHGVFSYYLMRGLRGEAAGPHGIIDADGLYRYVYYQTLQYVEQTNQQLRLVNQQKRNKGDTHFHSEYSLQTPKRIVEGVGETILGLKPHMTHIWQKRQALLIDGLMEQPLDGESPRSLVTPIAEVLQSDGNFELQCFSPSDYPAIADPWLEVRNVILRFLQSDPASLEPRLSPVQQVATRLLYFRGSIVTSEEGDSWLVLGDGAQISRAWLRQELRRSRVAQQVVILDCPGAVGLEDWLDDLKMESDYGQCILACASPADDPELFAQVLLEALIAANPQTGLPIATLLAKLQTNLDGLGLTCHLWLSGTQGLIEVLPSTSGNSPSASTPSISTKPMPAISATSNFKENALPFPQEVIASVLPEQASGTPTAISAPIGLEPIQDDPALTDLKHRLLPVLMPLVGPVAPTLIAQAAAIANHSHGLIETISQLLPANKCAAFARQAQAVIETWVDRPEETPPKQVVPVPPEPPTTLHQSAPDAEGLSSEHLAVAKQVLLELVGPITSVLLNQIPPETNSVAALVAALSNHLSAQQCAILEQRLSLISPVPVRPDEQSALTNAEGVRLTKSVESTKLDQVSTGSGRGVSTSNSGAIDETFIQTCEYELTRIVGPIAKWMVNGQRGEISKMSSVAFVETLAANIPNDQKAAEFRQRLLNVKF